MTAVGIQLPSPQSVGDALRELIERTTNFEAGRYNLQHI
jgi:hypothetical protein